MHRKVPKIIEEVGFDFSWDERKVWALEVAPENIATSELAWHFDIPFWRTPGGFYDLTPNQVLADASKYSAEYERILNADTSYPIDIMFWRGQWLILDGLHRLVKLHQRGDKTVAVRKIPKSAVPSITIT